MWHGLIWNCIIWVIWWRPSRFAPTLIYLVPVFGVHMCILYIVVHIGSSVLSFLLQVGYTFRYRWSKRLGPSSGFHRSLVDGLVAFLAPSLDSAGLELFLPLSRLRREWGGNRSITGISGWMLGPDSGVVSLLEFCTVPQSATLHPLGSYSSISPLGKVY